MVATAFRGYVSLGHMAARGLLAYKANFFFGQFLVFFQTLALLSIWRVLLGDGESVGGYTWDEMKAYLLIAYVARTVVSEGSDWKMADRILEGTVALDLAKPIDYQRARFSETLGPVPIELASSALVILGVIVVTGGVATPGFEQGVLFAMSLAAVIPLKIAIIFTTNVLCFWTNNFMGLQWTRDSIIALLSGAIIPLSFLPGWIQTIAEILPFASLVATPADIYLGRATGIEALGLIGLQVAWFVALYVLGRWLFNRGVRQLTVHGG